MKVLKLGVESELQLPAYTTAPATRDLIPVFDLHHSSWQHWILDPLSEARDQPTTSWLLVGFISTEPYGNSSPGFLDVVGQAHGEG